MNCAIYIDADNVSFKNIEEIINRSNNCNIIIRKIYADWTNESMKKWAGKAKQYGFQGIQCFGNSFKQTSDIYMITDIINDIYTNTNIEMIILATSDIDFTHLCHIIKYHNKKLVIFTPQKSSISNLVESEDKKIEKVKKNKKKKNKKNKILSDTEIEIFDEKLEYLKEAMKDSVSIYVSKFKKNLKEIIPNDKKLFDVNHIDKELVKYPNHFKIKVKGNKMKIYGLFYLHDYNKDELKKNELEIKSKFDDLFDIIEYNSVYDILKNKN